MNTMQIIHKLHKLAEYVESYEKKFLNTKGLELYFIEGRAQIRRDFDEQVKKVANELMTVSSESGYIAHRDDTFDQLFEKYLRIRSIDVLRGICLKMGVEI